MPEHINLRTVPAQSGWRWIVRGWQLLKANPVHIHMSVFFFLGVLGLLSIVPFIGAVLAGAFMPALYLGVMATIAQASTTSPANPAALMSALGAAFKVDQTGHRNTFKRLAQLGLVYCAVVFGVMAVFSFVVDDTWLKSLAMLGAVAPEASKEILRDSALRELMAPLGILVLYAPISMAFWFTQQLVGWHGQSISKAVFFSWLGTWRNKAAFVVYAISWVVIFMLTSLALSLLTSVLGLTQLAGVLLLPLAVFLMVWVFCSFYASYEDLLEVTSSPLTTQ